MGRVTNKVALITGAAKGIGRESALVLAREGAKIAVTDVDEKDGATVVEEIRKAGGEAVFYYLDVTNEDQWVKAVADTVKKFGALNILVNNAGIGVPGNVEEETLEGWRRTIAINLDGVFLGVKHAVRAMKSGNGSIINISSIEGIVGKSDIAAYNASKGGVRLLTKSAALYCAEQGYKIRVNSVHPGFILTPMVEDYFKKVGDVEELKAATAALHPIGRLGLPIDIANGVLYLASEESSFVTGSELVIDGGFIAK